VHEDWRATCFYVTPETCLAVNASPKTLMFVVTISLSFHLFMYYMSVLVLWHSGRGGDDRRQQTGDASAAGGDDLN